MFHILHGLRQRGIELGKIQVSHHVVAIKEEIERLREQVQNVE